MDSLFTPLFRLTLVAAAAVAFLLATPVIAPAHLVYKGSFSLPNDEWVQAVSPGGDLYVFKIKRSTVSEPQVSILRYSSEGKLLGLVPQPAGTPSTGLSDLSLTRSGNLLLSYWEFDLSKHKVFEVDPAGNLVRTFDKSQPEQQHQPAVSAVEGPAGNIYVDFLYDSEISNFTADGIPQLPNWTTPDYRNKLSNWTGFAVDSEENFYFHSLDPQRSYPNWGYIDQYNRNGTLLRSFGPHAASVDIGPNDNIYVWGSGGYPLNSAVLSIYSTDGTLLDQISGFDFPCDMRGRSGGGVVAPGGRVYMQEYWPSARVNVFEPSSGAGPTINCDSESSQTKRTAKSKIGLATKRHSKSKKFSVTLDSKQICSSRHGQTLKLRVGRSAKLKSLTFLVRGKIIKQVHSHSLQSQIVLRHLPGKAYTLEVRAKTKTGKRFNGKQRYNACK